jgi:hypothetical protein
MRSADVGIGEALTRIAETFGRLVVQHVQLLRSELEAEGQNLARRGRVAGTAVAKALPFVIAGIVVASIGIGQLSGLVLEPLLGRAAAPATMLLLGVLEAVLAGRWLKTHLPPTGSAATGTDGSSRVLPPSQSDKKSPDSPRPGVQEKAYGAVG